MRTNKVLHCVNNTSVKNILSNKISCSQCKFYNMDKATCRKFRDIYSTGCLVDSPAISCREDETKCGQKAVYFREKNEEDFQEEDDKQLWNDIKYPMLIYVIAIFAINYH